MEAREDAQPVDPSDRPVDLKTLDAATKVALERGFSAITVESVADALGVPAPQLAIDVGDRQQLVDRVIEYVSERAFRQVTQTQMPPLTMENARDQMLESISMYLAVVRSNPTEWRLVLLTPADLPDPLRDRIEAGRMQVHHQMVDVLKPILPESIDPALTAFTLSALADNYARLTLLDPAQNTIARLLANATTFIDGVMSEIARAREAS